MNNKKLYKMVVLALFIAIELVLVITPLGYIPIGAIRATTLHIPVILAGITLGMKEGAIMGLIFATTSFISNTFTPTPASFMFSPFYNGGNIGSLFICFIPRILIGVISAWIFKVMKYKNKFISTLALPCSAFIGSITNSTLVLLGIYIFFKDLYASYKGVAATTVASILLGQLSVNGFLEALIAVVLCSALGNILFKIIKK